MESLNVDLCLHIIQYLSPIDWTYLIFVSKHVSLLTYEAAEHILRQPQFHWLHREDLFISSLQLSSIEILLKIYTPKIIIVGGNEDSRRADILTVSCRRRNPKWHFSRIAGPSIKRIQEFDVIWNHGQCFVISGCSDSALGVVEVFDSIRNIWTLSAPLPRKLVGLSSICLDGSVYVLGGFDHTIFRRSCDVYVFTDNISNNTGHYCWINRDDIKLPRARSHCAAAIYKNKIWIAGGIGDRSSLYSHVDIYDRELSAWIIGPAMIKRRLNFRLLVVNDLLWAVGGDLEESSNSHALGSIECFNLLQNRWQVVTEYRMKRKFSCCCEINHFICVFGGSSEGVSHTSWDAFDTIKNIWVSELEHVSDTATAFLNLYEHSPPIRDSFGAEYIRYLDKSGISALRKTFPGRSIGLNWGVCSSFPSN